MLKVSDRQKIGRQQGLGRGGGDAKDPKGEMNDPPLTMDLPRELVSHGG